MTINCLEVQRIDDGKDVSHALSLPNSHRFKIDYPQGLDGDVPQEFSEWISWLADSCNLSWFAFFDAPLSAECQPIWRFPRRLNQILGRPAGWFCRTVHTQQVHSAFDQGRFNWSLQSQHLFLQSTSDSLIDPSMREKRKPSLNELGLPHSIPVMTFEVDAMLSPGIDGASALLSVNRGFDQFLSVLGASMTNQGRIV